MGIVTEFRQLQDDVKRLNTSAINSASTGVASVNATTAGMYRSTKDGFIYLGCTVYTSESAMLKDFHAGTLKLSDHEGQGEFVSDQRVSVKRGNNKIFLDGIITSHPGTPSESNARFLNSSFNWIFNAESLSAEYYVVARASNTGTCIACPVGFSRFTDGGKGGGGADQLDVVTNVYFSVNQTTHHLHITSEKTTIQTTIVT